MGWDSTTNQTLASASGHLGWLNGDQFTELLTSELYFNPYNILWGLQRTILSYLKANDELTGSNNYERMLREYDENGDGQIDYDETGKRGFWHVVLRLWADPLNVMGAEEFGFLKGWFQISRLIKYADEKWNSDKHDVMDQLVKTIAFTMAYYMSKSDMEYPDPFNNKMKWGKGKWPSLQYAMYLASATSIYGSEYPKISLESLYGYAFQYADKKYNDAKYTGSPWLSSDPKAIESYLRDVKQGGEKLDFLLYVPTGFGKISEEHLPNVEETDDAVKLFTAHFNGNKETW